MSLRKINICPVPAIMALNTIHRCCRIAFIADFCKHLSFLPEKGKILEKNKTVVL